MPATPTDNLIGSVLGGRYEIVARINRGGTAVVYRGIDRRLGRTVAVKIIHSDLSGDPGYVMRFDREARAAALLSHPNIVAVFDQGYVGERPYIVMEYVRGQSLRAIIASSAPLPCSMALAYADEIAKALEAAHEAGIIHRDIKPENVLITNDGQVKVTDFGLAKTITAQSSSASQGVLIGSISYIAPEIPQSRSAAVTSDIYSAGVVLYEMLTARKPHTGDDVSEVLFKHVNEDIPPPSKALNGQARPKIPDYVDALTVACTSRAQDRRPANGRVLEQRIARARRELESGVTRNPELAQELGAGQEVGAEQPPRPPNGRSRFVGSARLDAENTPVHTPVLTPVPRAATKLSKVAGAGSGPATSRPPRSAARPAKKSRVPLVLIIILLAVLLAAGGGLVYWLAVGRWTSVPMFAGTDQATAQALALESGFTLELLEEYSETVPTGEVIRTNPETGARVQKGATITAWVSKGQERYEMPTVVGLQEDEAKNSILAAHLSVGTVVSVWHEEVAAGVVILASQEPGVPLPPNTKIDLTVSQGREPITITSYVGQPLGTPEAPGAQQALEAAGYVVTVTEESSVDVAEGSVISQTPSEGTGHRGDAIALVVSTGPPLAEIPNVYGMALVDAHQRLAESGFFYQEENANSTGATLGFASGTNPPAGTMAPQGSTVTLFVV